ncbi:MAG: ABC transporter permease [Gemmatimonadota bacterium]
MSDAPGMRLLRLAARLVPAVRRDAWLREWEAEAVWSWGRIRREGRVGTLERLRFRARMASSFIDAGTEAFAALGARNGRRRMTGLTNDLRHAVRALLRRPGFTGVAVLTLALGIGASTAVFTLVNGVLLRALPFDDADALLSLRHEGRDGQDQLPISPGLYLLYQEQARTLDGVAIYTPAAGNLMVEGQPERLLGQAVTPSFFGVLRAAPALGRTFVDAEGAPGGESVVVLSDGLWRTRFGADPQIVGQSIDMGGVSRQVVGVMPAGFGYPDRESRFWFPLVIDPNQAPIAAFFGNGIARLAPGADLDAAQTEIGGMMGRLTELRPGDGGAAFLEDVNVAALVRPLKDQLIGDVTTTLWVLLGTVGFVLLIACANVANLLLVRAESRQRELTVRVAVGAGRREVLRTFMSESLVLGVLGGALGLVLAQVAVRTTISFIPSDLPRMDEIVLDARVLAFAAALVLGCVVFFGLFPMLRYGAEDLAGALKSDNARGSTGGRERHRLRNGLVVTQVALALVLLVGSGLMFRSFRALRSVDPGFEPGGTMTARLIVPQGEIADPMETATFFRQLRERLAAQPGVAAVGMITAVPLGGGGMSFGGLEVEDHPREPDELPIFASQPQADVGYFQAMGIDVLQGRGFERGDGGDGTRAVVVSRAFAQTWWPDTSPLGRRVRFGADNEDWYQIVGVVEDVRQNGLEEPSAEMVYFPTLTEADGQLVPARAQDVVLRASGGDPMALLPVLRREVAALNPRIPVADPRTMSEVFDGATARTSFTMAVLGAASGIALLLGLVGIYGVISYVVSQRTREIGVRMALGASAATVRGMVVRQGLALALAGVTLGLLVAALASRVMGSLLYGVSAMDPLTYAGVAATLVTVAVGAAWVPALRAAGVDPSRALRAE